MLALPWRRYSYHDFYINGFRINCVEATNDSSGTGLIVWDGAFVLAKFLEKRFLNTGRRLGIVLELGCGTGLAGLSAAALGASKVYLTDLEYALKNTKDNVAVNLSFSRNVECVELDWLQPDLGFLKGDCPEIILLADVAWVLDLVPPLAATCEVIRDHCTTNKPTFFLAHQTRAIQTDNLLFNELMKRGFILTKIPSEEYAEGYQVVTLYRFE